MRRVCAKCNTVKCNGFLARMNVYLVKESIGNHNAYNVFKFLCRAFAKPSPPDHAQSMRGVCAKYAAGMKTGTSGSECERERVEISTNQREQGECLT